jgi:hypothetical protein
MELSALRSSIEINFEYCGCQQTPIFLLVTRFF